MKKITLALTLLFAISAIYAQVNKRVAAYNYMNSGEFDKAKEQIDACITNPKTMSDYKTWWYYGRIYQNISVNKNFQSLDPNASQKALEAYAKALSMNFKDPANLGLDILNKEVDLMKFIKLISSKETKYLDDECFMDIILAQFPTLANTFVNIGVIEYKDTKNYQKALDAFESSLFLSSLSMKLDTPIYYYAALAAEKLQNFEKADVFYQIITQTGYGVDEKEKASMYYLHAKVKLAQKDTVAYIEKLKKGIEKYPNGGAVLVPELVNYYLINKQSDKALSYLKLAIEKDPSNATYHFAQGSLYDDKNVVDSAVICYKKAIELKPDYFDALYNLGAHYYNTAADIIDEANKLPANDMKKYDEMKKKADVEFGNSIPYLEKAHEITPKDMNTMVMLKTSYYKVGNIEKHDQIKAEITSEGGK
ncbi:MAG TPA: hypothetical protein DDX39_08590 [Bacteroidales bacterium]|nr:MAG: hypothetical protein A2W98_04605 [Bacteroidetes bacterium GWF2_33_38]OFY73247.1 MAG: hypothetical protein A2265_09335 [Bacteroidetes bacterium RIFOXYA12_FULL_33_9]OFY90799.1 MAG: hypothetical protein A2236_07485 [Bacteroidetes bacterium RIFOXYA2_FULL_33_7]HBF88685.1 hypothetical protein [Bacteroidales bacterium]